MIISNVAWIFQYVELRPRCCLQQLLSWYLHCHSFRSFTAPMSLCSGPAVSWDLIFHGPLQPTFCLSITWEMLLLWSKDKDITQQPPLFRALVRSRRPACTCSTSSPGPRQCSCPPRTRGEQRVNIFTEQQIFSPPRPGRTTWRGCGGCRPPRCRCPGWRGAGGRHTPCTPSPAAARSPPARWALGHQDPIFLQSLMWWWTKY